MPKDPCEIAILDVKKQRTTGSSKFFHIDFKNISICKYCVIELRFYLSNLFLFYSISKFRYTRAFGDS